MPEKFKFNDPIISVAKNPIPTRVLIARLDALRSKLDTLEDPDLESLNHVRIDLSNEKLLKHSKEDVQARVAYCIVNILHLYVPNVPYDASKLELIFKLFISQFKGLLCPESKNYALHVHILKMTATYDIFALINEIDESDKLIDSLFEVLYSVIGSEKFEPILQPYVVSILDVVIAEPSIEVSMKVMKMVMNKFLANTRVRKGEKTSILGFDVTLKLCERNAEKLSRNITKLLSDLLYEAAKIESLDSGTDSDSDDEQTAVDTNRVNEEQRTQLNKIHTLIIELWRYVPEILSSATGLLENELEADDIVIRTVATKAVGHILSITSHNINFVTVHSVVYNHWLKKSLDVNPCVRRAWISQLAKVIEARADLNDKLQASISTTLIDNDERVRLAIIYQLSHLKPSLFLERIASASVMSLMGQLVRDKHSLMRHETIKFLCSIYNIAIDTCDENQKHLITWIPDVILKLVYINDKSIEADVDFMLFDKLIPFERSPEKRVYRLLKLVSSLSQKSQASFFAMIKRQVQLNTVLSQLLLLIEEHNFDFDDTILLSKLTKAIEWLANRFPVKLDASLYFIRFFKLNNKRFFRLLTLCISSSSDYETVTNGLKELLTKLSNQKNIELRNEPSVNPEIMQKVMKLLLLRSSSIWYNASNISLIADISKDSDSPYNQIALLILDNISQINPILLKSNIEDLVKFVTEDTKTELRWRDLKAIHNYAVKFPDSFYNKICLGGEFYEKLENIATDGTPLESPFAIQILNGLKISDKTLYYHRIFNQIWPMHRESSKLNTHLATLGELFFNDYLTVEKDSKDIGKYLTDEILFKNYNLGEDGREWIEEDELFNNDSEYECNSKLLAIKIFSKWLSVETDDPSTTETMGKHILHTFLSNIIIRGGEITKTHDTPKRVAARLRLEAYLQILELSKIECLSNLVNELIIQRLIICIQDSNVHVREGCMESLKTLLTSNSISDKFLPLAYFVAHDPVMSLRSDMKIWIKAAFNKQLSKGKKELIFEKSWVRFLHILHNHFEFKDYFEEWIEACEAVKSLEGSDADESEKLLSLREAKNKLFKDFVTFASTFVIFTLNSIGTNDNISMLYYLSQRIKQCFDATSNETDPEDPSSMTNKRLFFLSDLVQLTISEVAKLKNWTLSAYTHKLKLPKDLYGSLTNTTCLEVSTIDYIPVESNDDAAMIIRAKWRSENSSSNTNKPKRMNVTNIEEAVASQQTDRSPIAKSRSKRKKVTTNNEESDSETIVSFGEDEYRGPSTKLGDSVSIRRSKRARRIDYKED